MTEAYSKAAPAILMLEDGTVYQGEAIGIKGTTSGELCFNTGMTVSCLLRPTYILVITEPK